MLRAFFFGLILALPLVWFFRLQETEEVAAWWDDAWHYRQRVDVTNNTSEETNVFIALTLDTSDTTKFQADCGDLRFTRQNGQLLEYYIASGCGTASTSVHVQFDTFLTGAQSIYAYYGNGAAQNGFASADFSIEASDYTIGGVASEEVGPGPVAYWKFDEGSGTTAFDSASYGLGDELLTDGDMEATDTSAWTEGRNCTPSKETVNPYSGTRSLRITEDSANYPYLKQTVLTVGKRYRITGRARGDGSVAPAINNTDYGTTNIWKGTTSTNWQEIDFEFVADETFFGLRLASAVSGGEYVEFDDISVREVVSGNQGTISGATWVSEDQCPNGKCLNFDGIDDYVTMGNIETANFTSSDVFTLSVWVNPSTIGESGYIIGKNSIGKGYALYWAGAENAIALASGVNYVEYVSDPVFTEYDTWVHITAVFDNGNVSYYKNGQLSGTYSGHSFAAPTSDESVIIGNRNGGGVAATYFSGLIDEVKIFPYALTEDQIKTEYNLGAAAVMGTGPLVTLPSNGTLKDSLVAHWSFDEQAGQTVHDKVGGNDGTRGADANAGSDDPTWKSASECKVNGCASFDGVDDYVDLGNPSVLDFGTGEFSASAWFKANDVPNSTFMGIVSKGGYNDGLELRAAKSSAGIYDIGGYIATDKISSDTEWIPDQWHHITFTRNSSGNWTWYVDGQQKTSGTSTTSLGVDNWEIGRMRGSLEFNGLIDEVKIYNTALTADQVRQDMNAGASVSYSVRQDEADDLTDGAGDPPVAEWRFDEKQGATAYDTSGNENNGTVNGATWKSAARCHQGACLEFDGGEYVSTDDNPTLDIDGGISISAWFNPSVITNYQTIIGKRHASLVSANYVVRTGTGSNTDELEFYFVSGGNWQVFTTSNANLEADNWYYVTVVYNEGSLPKIYLNGTLLTGACGTGTCIGAMTLDSNSVGIGRPGDANQQYFSGQIDYVKIYDYARTPAQIAYDYNRGKPIAHWKFDECEGTVAHDSSGNDNHGTINIGATGSQATAGTCETSGAWGNGASGKFNGSLNFDGSDDYVEIAHNDIFNLKPQQSFSFWYNGFTETGTLERTFIDKSTTHQAGNGYSIDMRGQDGFRFNLSGTRYILGKPSNFNDGNWHHVIVVLDQSANEVELYFDGKLFSTTDISGATYATNTDSMLIGTVNLSSSYYYFLKTKLDDVRIYNYALSPAQVQKVMNEGMAVRYGPILGGQ